MIALVLGGARSGKSEVAERLCAATAACPNAAPVTYVATAIARDGDMAERIAAHQSRRPSDWTTVEAGPSDVPELVRTAATTVLVDSLTTWVAEAPGFKVDGEALCLALVQRQGDAVLVSDEVGLGVHPSTEAGRVFRDRLGELNRQVADVADQVLLVVAGRVLSL